MNYGWLAQPAARAGHLVALVSPGPDCVRASSLTSLHQKSDAPGYRSGRDGGSHDVLPEFRKVVSVAGYSNPNLAGWVGCLS